MVQQCTNEINNLKEKLANVSQQLEALTKDKEEVREIVSKYLVGNSCFSVCHKTCFYFFKLITLSVLTLLGREQGAYCRDNY